MKKKVAIIGCAKSMTGVRRLYNDLDQYEVWGLNQLYSVFPEIVPKATRWFQIHHEDRMLEGDHLTLEWMKEEHPFPIYVRDDMVDRFPSAVAFPRRDLEIEFGTYFSSQMAWMIALAIYEKFEEIHLYGIHMALEDEYIMQKDGVEYYIGLARGRGITVFVPAESELLKSSFLYGFENPTPLLLKVRDDLNRHEGEVQGYNEQRNKNKDQRIEIKLCLKCGHTPDDVKPGLEEKLLKLQIEAQQIRDNINQTMGRIGVLKYLQTNWLFKMGDQSYGKCKDEAFHEDRDSRRDEGETNNLEP